MHVGSSVALIAVVLDIAVIAIEAYIISVSLGSAEEPYDSDMTHSYRLTEGRLTR